MGKRISAPILPAYKRARETKACHGQTVAFSTEAKRAFDLGRGGSEPTAYIEGNAGLYRQWQAGYRQRSAFIKSMDAAGKDCRTPYEKSLAKAEAAQAEADDKLLEQQMQVMREAMAKAGITNLTRKALMQALRAQ